MSDALAELIAELALRLTNMQPGTPEYEQVGTALAEWLLVFESVVVDNPTSIS